MKTFKIKLSDEQAAILYKWLTGFYYEERILAPDYSPEEEIAIQEAITKLRYEVEAYAVG